MCGHYHKFLTLAQNFSKVKIGLLKIQLQRAGPVIGRILTRQGYFAGIIEEVEITETEFIFSIRNPRSPKEKRGKNSEYSCNFLQSNWRRTIHLDLLQDIQIYQDREGNPLSLDALLNHNNSNN